MASRLLAVALATLGLATATAAPAQELDESAKNAARDLGREGVRHFEQGNYERARELFNRGYALVPAPTLAIREARALVKLHRLVEAAEAYARAMRLPADATMATREAVADAQAELSELRPRIPRLLVTVEGSGAAVARIDQDGQTMATALIGVERAIDPGTYRLTASAPGAADASEVVTLREGEARAVVLRVSVPRPPERAKAARGAAAADPRSDLRPWGWAAVGVGATALSVGVTTGLLALDRKADLDRSCRADGGCPPSSSDDLDAFRTLRTVSTVGYIGGAVTMAAGLGVLLFAPPVPDDRASISPVLGLGSAGVRGRF